MAGIKHLPDRGADLRPPITNGWSALMLDGRHGACTAAFSAISPAVAGVDDSAEYGTPVLVLAAWRCPDTPMINILTAGGARVNRANTEGMTPLILAAKHNPNPEIIKALSSAGAQADAKDTVGWTPIIFSVKKTLFPEVLMAPLNAGADVNARNEDNRTPPILAAVNIDDPADPANPCASWARELA